MVTISCTVENHDCSSLITSAGNNTANTSSIIAVIIPPANSSVLHGVVTLITAIIATASAPGETIFKSPVKDNVDSPVTISVFPS